MKNVVALIRDISSVECALKKVAGNKISQLFSEAYLISNISEESNRLVSIKKVSNVSLSLHFFYHLKKKIEATKQCIF